MEYTCKRQAVHQRSLATTLCNRYNIIDTVSTLWFRAVENGMILNAEVMTITNICSTNSLLGYRQHLQLCTEGGGGGGGSGTGAGVYMGTSLSNI